MLVYPAMTHVNTELSGKLFKNLITIHSINTQIAKECG